ncbi:MAG: hypothetical protein H4O13_02610 [Xanthomonadales bacterium]|nr:hypothetical protein [Xanthomonadales bacterium]
MHSCALMLPLSFSLALIFSPAAGAQSTETDLKSAKQPQVDARLSSVLDATDVRYTALESGDLEVLAALPDGRRQRVILRSSTHAYRREEWREVYSIAHELPTDSTPPPALLERLLVDNDTLVLGAWSVARGRVALVTRLPARSSPLRVVEAIDFVAEVADALERELEGDLDQR